MTFEELKARAVRIEDQMEVFWPQFNRHETISLDALNLEGQKCHYAYNNSVIAFVDEDGVLYVLPDIGAQKILKAEGYTRGYFYVPFSNWDYPVAYEEKWKLLWDSKNRH